MLIYVSYPGMQHATISIIDAKDAFLKYIYNWMGGCVNRCETLRTCTKRTNDR